MPMTRPTIRLTFADRRLLDHPFYVRWSAGVLGRDELAAYAAQYRHFERALPLLLRRLLEKLDGDAAALVRQNLEDEEGNPEPHVTMFERFASETGASETAPTEATRALLATYERLIESSGAEGMAAVAAYELQAPEVAASKAQGLRERYGFSEEGARFWAVHAEMDRSHGEWLEKALAELPQTQAESDAARAAADAWWALLDEREVAGAASG
jgi:pyrroloquinoline quinone (PQQ) biosynthesis protein C